MSAAGPAGWQALQRRQVLHASVTSVSPTSVFNQAYEGLQSKVTTNEARSPSPEDDQAFRSCVHLTMCHHEYPVSMKAQAVLQLVAFHRIIELMPLQ